MQQVNISLVLQHPSLELLASQTCRHVLMSGVEHDAYVGNFTGILEPAFVDGLLEQAYEKIIRLVNHITALKGARNSLSPISRLPPEVLLSVFKRCTDWNQFSHYKLAISQVCTSWRRLALADPTLWTTIDFSKPELAYLMMERAQQAPLSLVISTNAVLELDRFPERRLVQSLRAVSHHDPVEVQISNYLSGNFPILRKLHVEVGGRALIRAAAFVAPVLEELSLSNVALRNSDVYAHVVGNLTSLRLVYATATNTLPSEPLWTPRRILSVLKLCPRLISLSLRNSIRPNTTQERINSKEDVELPNLELLDLEEVVSALSELLSHLRVPRCQDIQLVCSKEAAGTEARSILPALVRQHMDAAGWHHMDAAWLNLSSSTFDVQLPSNSHGIPNKNALVLKIERHLHWAPGNMNFFLRSLADHILRDITRLTINVRALASAADVGTYWPHLWAAISTLPNLNTLRFSGNVKNTWIPLHRPFVHAPDVQDPVDGIPRPPNPFHALRNLKLEQFDLTAPLHGTTLFRHLMAFKEVRQAAGRRVDMTFQGCKQPALEPTGTGCSSLAVKFR